MRINFFNVTDNTDKLDKSTGAAMPSDCELYGNFSIKNPVLKVREVKGNYVQIANSMFDYNYYFVYDKVYKDGYYLLYLMIDVLMSYNADIKNATVHVTRNENSYTPEIPDSMNTVSVRKTNIIYPFGTGIPYSRGKNYILIWRG